MNRILKQYNKLLLSVPGVLTTMFCISVVLMNILAEKVIVNTTFLSVDGGTLLSFIPFLCMDLVTKHYGVKEANMMNFFALCVNLFFVMIFNIVSHLYIQVGDAVSLSESFESFNTIFSSTWFVLLSSSLAFVTSGVVNNFINKHIEVHLKTKNDKALYYISSLTSTFIGQFLDNFIFTFLVFYIFAPIFWGYNLTLIQCLGSAVFTGILEFVMQAVFSPIGYRILKNWRENKIGADYINSLKNIKC